MTQSSERLISRKTVAAMLGDEITVEMVRKNERRWGLIEARLDLNARCIRYRESLVRSVFSKRFGI